MALYIGFIASGAVYCSIEKAVRQTECQLVCYFAIGTNCYTMTVSVISGDTITALLFCIAVQTLNPHPAGCE